MEFQNEINKQNYLQELEIEKSTNPNLISIYELSDLLKSDYEIVPFDENAIEKAQKDVSKLIKKEVWVTNKQGKSYKMTVYVKEKEPEKQVDTPVGEELSPTVKGMNITKYSDKALLIKGDTKTNLETLRSIKKEIGVGTWNNKLSGWVFPLKYVETVLGYIWSDLKNKGEDEKADAVQNQKNAGLEVGDKPTIQGIEGEVKKNVSDSDGTKYNVKLGDGTELNGVDEKVLDKKPETDDKKIAETVNNASPESRVPTEKKIYGIQPVKDIHNYTLAEYMGMHGLDQTDIDKAIAAFTKPKTGDKKRSGGGGSGTPKKSEKSEQGMTKKQLIAKLIYAHYQAVQKAVKDGEAVKPEVLATYADLQKEVKDRKPMSEETKRKISEALKKNKAEPIVIDKRSPQLKKEQEKLDKLITEKEKLNNKVNDLREKRKNESDYSKKNEIEGELRSLYPEQKKQTKLIRSQSNLVQALGNGGESMSIADEVGTKHNNIPDFRQVDTTDIGYDIDSILTADKPLYVPEIDEEQFRSKGFILDAIRIDSDSYMVAVNGHSEKGEFLGYSSKTDNNEYTGFNSETMGYVTLTLDQLVLTNDYYTTKQKALYKQRADEKNQRAVDHWNAFSDERKKRYYDQRGFYRSLPAKIRKKTTEAEWDNLSMQEKEKIYIPVKKYNPERLKSQLDEGHMWTSFHDMHQRFVDKDAYAYKKVGGEMKPRPLGSGGGGYGNPKTFKAWNEFSEMLDWKLKDIRIQKEEYSETYQKGRETSFGVSNTNDSLLESDGVLVKRQNGEQIKPKEIEQLKNAWDSVQKSFGSLKENARADNLKLSHTGKTLIYARKAMGVYVPSMKTIGVSAKYGEDQLGFTLGHEAAHWIDNTLGKKNGKRYASDNYESTAGQIAIAFRRNLNEKTKSDYTNSTAECFARAFEQYHAIESFGENAQLGGSGGYFAARDYVSKQTYDSAIKPLIEQFLQENKDILKGTLFDIFK